MKTVLVTGSSGFIGSNLVARLAQDESVEILRLDRNSPWDELERALPRIDFIFHLAGINRPKCEEEFQDGNVDLTRKLLDALIERGMKTPVLLSSSTQAERDNAYGNSKRQAEDLVKAYGETSGAPVFIYRLPNAFGKWCRPHYNSVVATFCHQIANGEPIQVSDRSAKLSLAYVDDIVTSFIAKITALQSNTDCLIPVIYQTTLGELADTLHGFHESRSNLFVPDCASGFERAFYATFLSYLPRKEFSYKLKSHCDERGAFTELVKTRNSGQFSISTSKPGITRGNHFHHTKNEKFIVIKGEAVIRFRDIRSDDVFEYPVSGTQPEVVDVPPGYTHNITNTGSGEMILAIWVNEAFDPANPDTYFEQVQPSGISS